MFNLSRIGLVLALFSPFALSAQQPAASPAAATASADAEEQYRLARRGRSDLMNLVTMQQALLQSENRIIGSTEGLKADTRFRISEGNTLWIRYSEGTSWSAEARVEGHRGNCVVWVGEASGVRKVRTEIEKKRYPSGQPACDGDGRREKDVWEEAGLKPER